MRYQSIRAILPVAAAVAVVTAALPQNLHAAPATPDISGIYWATTYSSRIQPVGGGDPPYKPEAMAEYRRNMADIASGKLEDRARTYCVPDGVPRVAEDPYPFEIAQAPNRGEIYLLYEINHVIRRVDMEKPLPPLSELEDLPFYVGRSAGHWDGNTLVIDTAGFNTTSFLDNSGAPHSEQLRTTERIRKLDDKTLENIVTIHDPVVFTKDWQARFVYQARPDLRIMDWNCGEKHRDISKVQGVKPQ
jgi:hypothetical protein